MEGFKLFVKKYFGKFRVSFLRKKDWEEEKLSLKGGDRIGRLDLKKIFGELIKFGERKGRI